MKSRMFPYVIGVKGFCAVVAQTLLIRELLAVFGGNELTLAVIFCVWLIAGAAGSAIVGRFWHQAEDPLRVLGFFVVFFCLTLPLSLLALRFGRLIFSVPFGEVLAPGPIVLICLAGCALPAMADGAFFTLAARLSSPAGKIYLWESLGIVAGGVFFTCLLATVANAFAIAFVIAAISSGSLALLMRDQPSRIHERRAWLWCVFFLLFSTQAPKIQNALLRMQAPGKAIVACAPSYIGNITVTKEKERLAVFTDGLPAGNLSFNEDASFFQDFVNIPMLVRPLAKEVLFIGADPSVFLAETRKYSVRRLTYAATDPSVIKILRKLNDPEMNRLLDDQRLRVSASDARRFLKISRERFDAIFVWADLPASLAMNRYYTEEFFQEAARHLDENGLFITAIPGSLSFLSDELKALNASHIATLKRAFPSVTVIPGDGVNIFCASKKYASFDPYVLSQNITTYNIRAPLINAAYLESRLQAPYRDWFAAGVRFASPSVNRELRPVAFYQALDLIYARSSREIPKLFNGRQKIRSLHLAILIFIVFFSWRRLVPRATALAKTLNMTILTTGFFAMAIQVAVFFLFESLSGNLYRWLPLLTAAFMGGAAGGAWMAHAQEKCWTQLKYFLWIEWTLPPASALFMLGTIAGMNLFAAASVSVGLLAGSQFSLVTEMRRVKERLNAEETSNLAGRLYGLDLLGACLGAFAVPLILIPSCGLVKTILILLLIKVANAWNLTNLKR